MLDRSTAARPRSSPGTLGTRLAFAIPLLIWLAMLIYGAGETDRRIVVAAHVGEDPWLTPVLFLTRLGDWELLVGLPFFAAAWLVLKRKCWRVAVLLLGATLSGRLLVDIQKVSLSRIRPEEFDHPVVVNTFAFPSGHAANSLIVYGLLALVLTRPGAQRASALLAAVVLAALIGLSRVLLGVHWPSDVIGGWAFGTAWLLLSWEVGRRWARLEPDCDVQ